MVAMLDALSKFPDTHYVWFLDASGFIMNPNIKLEDDIMQPAKLEALMKKDFPVVPPDGIIKTFSHLRGQDVDLALTQDQEGLSSGSLIVRNSEWARFFLETWFNPLYRSYSFQKAETHALVRYLIDNLKVQVAFVSTRVLITACRNTLCSGIPPSSPGWQSSTNAPSTPTSKAPKETNTKMATLSLDFQIVLS